MTILLIFSSQGTFQAAGDSMLLDNFLGGKVALSVVYT